MRVEFLVNTDIGCDGRQIFIEASEFLKASSDEEEFNSFAFSTQAFFSFYGFDDFIMRDQFDVIKNHLEKSGAVIITVTKVGPRRYCPEVYVSNRNRIKKVDIYNF